MMRYLPARGVIVPATVAFAAGCRAEISNMPAPAPAKVIARHTGTPKAPGYVACTAPTDPNIPLGPAPASTPFDSDSLDPRTPCCRGWAARYASAGTTRPGRVRKASSRKEVSPG
ncbi:MAG: hypothetical protein ACLQB1_00705 [Streptosporangiaceae bacterium]